MKLILVSLFLSIFIMKSHAQEVQSGAYNLILKTLLKHDVPEISVPRANSLQSQNLQVVFLDTRARKEYEVSHLKDAVWVGYDDFELSQVDNIPKDTKIIAYCSVGVRSEKVTRKLIEAGYTDVQNLYGSIFEWVNQDNPVYNMQDEKTSKVHAYSKAWGIWLKKGEKVYD